MTQVVITENIRVELVSSSNPSVSGRNVSFTATITGYATPPVGTITFRDNGVVMKSVGISGSKASYSTNKLSVGIHEITATYDLTGEADTVNQEVLDKTKSAEILTGLEPEVTLVEPKVFPNPFSERLKFEFVSPVDMQVRIILYDMTGRLVSTVFDAPIDAGVTYISEFIPESEISGMYVYRIFMGDFYWTGKVTYKKTR